MTARNLDHVVVAVREADDGGRAYERLGFQVMPLMRHIELGCCNRVIAFAGNYLELLGDIDRSVPELRDRLAPRLDHGEGLALMSLSSVDLDSDLANLLDARISDVPAIGRIYSARRKVRLPDGTDTETDSRALYFWRERGPYGTFFYTEHRKPEAIWIPAYRHHPNSARCITAISYCTADPAADADYVQALLGVGPQAVSADEVVFRTARGERIEFLTPSQARRRFGDGCAQAGRSQPVRGIALEIAVADLDRCRGVLHENSASTADSAPDRIRVPAGAACGVTLDFIAAAEPY